MLRGKATPTELAGYWIVQALAGVAAAAVVGVLKQNPPLVATVPPVGPSLKALAYGSISSFDG